MKKSHFVIVVVALITVCIAFVFYQNKAVQPVKLSTTKVNKVLPKKTIIQPIGKQNSNFNFLTFQSIKQVIKNATLVKGIKMPKMAYVSDRGRYRADTIIHWLNLRAKDDEILVGITNDDISATKGQYQDWGIMGLGYCPGKACVVSDYRIKNKTNYFKVVLHELGHTMGLGHCVVKSCFMRDAEGHDTTDEETEFCTNCKNYLKNKGWEL